MVCEVFKIIDLMNDHIQCNGTLVFLEKKKKTAVKCAIAGAQG